MTLYKLDLDRQKRNVFVTQLRDDEDEDDYETIKKFPIVCESSRQLLSTGIKTLPSTLLIQRTNEADRLQEELEKKKEEYDAKLLMCKKKEETLRRKQVQITERVNKFDKFIKETEVKRRRALEKYRKESKLKEQKSKELEIFTEELKKLQESHTRTEKLVEKFSVYHEYLLKVVDVMPADYFDTPNDSVLLGIMMRHETLHSTFQLLSAAQTSKTDEIKAYQQNIQDLKQQLNQQLLVDNSELAKLHTQLEQLTQYNVHVEHVLENSEEIYRQKQTTLGRVKLAVLNLAEKSLRKHCPPLVSLDIFQMLTVIQDFIRDSQDVYRIARNMMVPVLGDIDQSDDGKQRRVSQANHSPTGLSINDIATEHSEELL